MASISLSRLHTQLNCSAAVTRGGLTCKRGRGKQSDLGELWGKWVGHRPMQRILLLLRLPPLASGPTPRGRPSTTCRRRLFPRVLPRAPQVCNCHWVSPPSCGCSGRQSELQVWRLLARTLLPFPWHPLPCCSQTSNISTTVVDAPAPGGGADSPGLIGHWRVPHDGRLFSPQAVFKPANGEGDWIPCDRFFECYAGAPPRQFGPSGRHPWPPPLGGRYPVIGASHAHHRNQ
jgi:hypothetical protein